jgi:hypothetical protein
MTGVAIGYFNKKRELKSIEQRGEPRPNLAVFLFVFGSFLVFYASFFCFFRWNFGLLEIR